jgi:hypothetical protein
MEVRISISDKVAEELLYYTGKKNLSESLDYIIEE